MIFQRLFICICSKIGPAGYSIQSQGAYALCQHRYAMHWAFLELEFSQLYWPCRVILEQIQINKH
ncbi:hypothetical protein BT96DRAFT_148819 [Gymnopus androsaceus JB14]|uniref:Uncharacterized protein n=1 Tax=Gymnopus androsaceus JB14 TaxID=1447944 RepID=A0A6A4ICZ1_9AGAR|nr:hypothetical protein BT96DRAFT_148819 [Gymnopus androsaceus JB14]